MRSYICSYLHKIFSYTALCFIKIPVFINEQPHLVWLVSDSYAAICQPVASMFYFTLQSLLLSYIEWTNSTFKPGVCLFTYIAFVWEFGMHACVCLP